ncbi:MAG: septum formation initiator family protein [Clostridia bacterium]|nr:septum formation initiator family protein [Clostridia bacterium]
MKKEKSSKIGLIVVGVLIIYLSYLFIGQEKIFSTQKNEYVKLQTKITEETKKKEQLQKQKEAIQSDEYVEKLARQKLGMVKQGERVFVDINK